MRKKGGEWESRLERFLSSLLALRAGEGLSESACVALYVGEEAFFLGRKKGRNTLGRVRRETCDVRFWVPEDTMHHLLSLAEHPETGIASMGIAVFENILTSDHQRKIRFRLEVSPLGLWSKGYFSVLKAGGPEVASYLARFGLNGLSAVKEMLKRL